MRPRAQRPLAPRWWESCSGITRPYLKAHGATLRDVAARLEEIRALGFDAVEVFAPCAGGTCYHGLDTIDFYQVDPAIGTMGDFLALVDAAHARGMALVIFINLGYAHEHFPAFLKACDDVRAGVDSPERRWFLWSDSGTDTMDRSLAPHFMNDSHGNWRWSERAQKYFWVKWEGERGGFHLPQFNFADPGWQDAARRILEFWLRTGIDGVVIDAVNWYVGCDWQITRRSMTDAVNAAGDLLLQPEGAGGFRDDPAPWITAGGFNCVQDYALQIWWERKDLIRDAIRSGDPRPIEAALRGYRDRVVAAGGICYLNPLERAELSPQERLLGAATVATVGELFAEFGDLGDPQGAYRRGVARLLEARRRCPALCAAGRRIPIPTSDDRRFYAFVREPAGPGARALVILNFQPERHTITVDLRGQAAASLADIWSGATHPAGERFSLELPGYGYGVYTLS
ncbi:MAG TPA: alpha-amylase family glycosyl hydrolase [Roseiflexaceae bacterium]|nr:alpha-amylase family glycosyl hydrolase [Roseiflexaceae bacterium]